MKESFKELVDLIGERNSAWVELRTGIKICLVAVSDYKTKVLTGRYTPCVPKARTFPIKYEQIKCIDGGRK